MPMNAAPAPADPPGLVVTAAQQVVEVSAARRGWFTSKVSIDHLAVRGPDGPMWSISSLKSCESRGRVKIAYRVEPADFKQLRPARPLAGGVTYSAYVGGCGLIGFARFEIVDGRIFQVEGTGADTARKLVPIE